MIFKNKGKQKVIAFTKTVELLQQGLKDNNLERLLQDTNELIENNEYGIAFENLLTNLNEFDYSLHQKQIELAKEAIGALDMNWKDWAFIQKLADN